VAELAVLPKDDVSNDAPNNTPLRSVLDGFDIKPFTPESVMAYKKKMITKHPPNIWWYKSNLVDNVILSTMAIGAIVVCLGFFATIISGLFAIPDPTSSLSFQISVGVLACGIVVFCTNLIIQFLWDRTTVRAPGVWMCRRHDVVDSLRFVGVPEHVCRIAQIIKEQLPDVHFSTETFIQREMKDPFLVVLRGDEEYHIAVWGNEDLEGLEGFELVREA